MPAWHGIFYAVLMLVCAQGQSLLLAQYFARMMVMGMQIRTGIISAVYRKVSMKPEFPVLVELLFGIRSQHVFSILFTFDFHYH